MKEIIILILFVSFSLFSNQEGKDIEKNIEKSDLKSKKKVVKVIESYKLSDKAYWEWKTVYDIWFKEHYFQCLKKYKIKMTCRDGCEYNYIDLIFDIDKDGKIKKHKIIKSKLCKKNRKIRRKIERCLIDPFLKKKFPKEIKDIKIKAKLGTGLKC